MGFNLPPAAMLGIQILAYLAGIWLVVLVFSKLTSANQMIENAKHIPGGVLYKETEEVDDEEIAYRAHA